MRAYRDAHRSLGKRRESSEERRGQVDDIPRTRGTTTCIVTGIASSRAMISDWSYLPATVAAIGNHADVERLTTRDPLVDAATAIAPRKSDEVLPSASKDVTLTRAARSPVCGAAPPGVPVAAATEPRGGTLPSTHRVPPLRQRKFGRQGNLGNHRAMRCSNARCNRRCPIAPPRPKHLVRSIPPYGTSICFASGVVKGNPSCRTRGPNQRRKNAG